MKLQKVQKMLKALKKLFKSIKEHFSSAYVYPTDLEGGFKFKINFKF